MSYEGSYTELVQWSKEKSDADRYRNYLTDVIEKRYKNAFDDLNWGKHEIRSTRAGTVIASSYPQNLPQPNRFDPHQKQTVHDLLGPGLDQAFNRLMSEARLPYTYWRGAWPARGYHYNGNAEAAYSAVTFLEIPISGRHTSFYIPNAKEFVERFDVILKSHGVKDVFVRFSVPYTWWNM